MACRVENKRGTLLARKAAFLPAKVTLTRKPCIDRRLEKAKHKAALSESAEHAASHEASLDEHTQFITRQAFFAEMEKEIKRLNRNDSTLSLLLIEVDQFTRLTEQDGFEGSERVMVELSRLLKQELRITDLPARLGGEEFGVLLPDTDGKGAIAAAERFRGSVLERFDKGSHTLPLPVTVSIGIASASMLNALDASELFKQADTRKYIAKHSGANQVSFDALGQLH